MDCRSAARRGPSGAAGEAVVDNIDQNCVFRFIIPRRSIGMLERHVENTRYPQIVMPSAEIPAPADRCVEGLAAVASDEERTLQRALARLQQYLKQVLAEDDAEAAMLGVANGLLIKMLIQLERSIDSVLAECPVGTEYLAVVTRGIETALRLTCQIHRFGHLRHVLSEARAATARLTDG
jgi:hypothetical protein